MRPSMIYLDMDGVLADFDTAVAAHGVQPGYSYIHLPPSEWTPAQRTNDDLVREVMDGPDFWPSIPRMHGALGLVTAAALIVGGENVFILTATPRLTSRREHIAHQKTEWAVANLGFASRQVITCLRSEKAQWAKPSTVLVDDLPTNCTEWEKAGGVAIRHTDARSSVAKLLEYRLVPAD